MRPLAVLLVCATLAAVEVPAVQPLPDPSTYAIAVIPDLRTALAHEEQALGASGITIPPGMLAMALGSQFGDPGLTALKPGPVVLACGTGVPVPTWCAVLPIGDPTILAGLAARMGLLSEAVPGGFAIGSAPGGIELAKRVTEQATVLGNDLTDGTDLRLVVSGDRLVRDYLPFIINLMQQGAAQATTLPGQPVERSQHIIQALTVGLRTLAHQAGTARIDVGASATGWQVDVVAVPAPASALSQALQPTTAGADLGARLGASDTPPVFAASGRFPPALYAATAEMLSEARADAVVGGMIDERIIALLQRFAAVTDGRFAVRQGVAGHPTRQLMVQGVADTAAMRLLLDDGLAMLQEGSMRELLRSVGLDMTVQGDYRRSGSTQVDRLTYTIDPAGGHMPAEAQMLEAMLEPVEWAVANDVLAIGGPSASVDAVLAGPAASPLLPTAAAWGAGYDIVADFDLPLQMRLQYETMRLSMPTLPPFFANEQGGHPVQVAVAFAPGRLRIHALVPAKLVSAMRQGIQEGMANAHPPMPPPAKPLPAEPPTF